MGAVGLSFSPSFSSCSVKGTERKRGLEKRAKRVKKEREEWGTGDPWVLLGEGDVLQEGGKNSCSFLENFFGVTIALPKNPNRLKLELENRLFGFFAQQQDGLFFSFLLFFFNSFCGNSAPVLLRPSSSCCCDNLNSNYCSTPVPFPSLFLFLFLALVVVETVVKREGKGKKERKEKAAVPSLDFFFHLLIIHTSFHQSI